MSGRTTLSVNRETHEKFKRAKPYDSLSADEFVEELIEEYERGDA